MNWKSYLGIFIIEGIVITPERRIRSLITFLLYRILSWLREDKNNRSKALSQLFFPFNFESSSNPENTPRRFSSSFFSWKFYVKSAHVESSAEKFEAGTTWSSDHIWLSFLRVIAVDLRQWKSLWDISAFFSISHSNNCAPFKFLLIALMET